MAKKTRGALPVRGWVEDATEAGFASLLKKANEVYDDGLLLINVVSIGQGKIGGVFVRLPEQGPRANLIGD